MRKQKIKIKKKDLKAGNGIDDFSIPICGNCIHYIWSHDGDCHKGDCEKRDDADNCICLMARVPDGLHALTGTKYCNSFKLKQDNDTEIEIFVNEVKNEVFEY
ncbi:hypothetical protein KKG31_01905 [Patescibacteria group bacterium]|nr:hypothetical protein [Patescibacteria group bacterium]